MEKKPGLQTLQLLKYAYLKSLQENPLPTKAVTSCLLNMVANTIAQFIAKEKTFNYKKVLSYGSFSLLVSGPLYHYWYILLDKIFQGKTGKLYLILQLFVDQAIFSPFYFVLFYVYMALLDGTLSSVHNEIRKNIIPSSISSATVWVPVQFITFKYIPPHLRVLWNNLIALGWNIYFSLYNSEKSNNN